MAAKREALAELLEAVQQDAILSTCNSMAFTNPPPINKNESCGFKSHLPLHFNNLMNDCEYCGARTTAPSLVWSEGMTELRCFACEMILEGIAAYKAVFGVEYVLPKRQAIESTN